MEYLEFTFVVKPLEPASEILVAQLGAIGFESFVETEEGVLAYIQKIDWREGMLDEVAILNSSEYEITTIQKEIAQENWNKTWESNFQPIMVGEQCAVRAPFHEPFGVRFEIVIEPKMSFGTGHHETTFMMLQFVLEAHCEGKSVLDMGCGTAVLAILASMKGASEVDAIDIDDWCVENSEENIQRNNCEHIMVRQGDASTLPFEATYDIILANINRNILLKDMSHYVSCLKKGGALFLSGFYKEDVQIIKECCNNLGMQYVGSKEKNNWIAIKFVH